MIKDRLEDLCSYPVFNSEPSSILDDITEIASLICNVPVSLITIVDDKKQWFLSKKGVEMNETSLKESFCKHALQSPHEVLVITEPQKDQRFYDNPMVHGQPYVQFYAGAPLITRDGNVLGTLCVLDVQPREFSQEHQKALQILAKQAMDYINSQKIIDLRDQEIANNAKKLKNLTDALPLIIYQLTVADTGETKLDFVNQGVEELFPNLDVAKVKKAPSHYFNFLVPQDALRLKRKWIVSQGRKTMLDHEYQTIRGRWHHIKAAPEVLSDGTVEWHGYIEDIHYRREYENTLEEILFDISHVLRRPVTNLVGLSDILNTEVLEISQIREYNEHVRTVIGELERFTTRLNRVYEKKHRRLLR